MARIGKGLSFLIQRTVVRDQDEQEFATLHCMPRELPADLTIVVVEDHDDARRYIEIFLRQLGASVIGARNAIEGLEAIKTHRPTLVLSDIMMPAGDGFELLRQIRALESGGERVVPVVAMTALVSSADGQRILNAGFSAYLRKPFTPDKLLETIRSVLND